jgi:hypothetical protein
MTSPGATARLYLLRANRDAVSVVLSRSIAGGLSPGEAVVIIADQRDPLGHELAVTAAEKAGLDADTEGAKVDARGEIPTTLLVLKLRSAHDLFRESHPEVTAGLAKGPGHGRVRIVVIAEGAAMLVHADVSPLPSGARSS